jgi:hypothetical protein
VDYNCVYRKVAMLTRMYVTGTFPCWGGFGERRGVRAVYEPGGRLLPVCRQWRPAGGVTVAGSERRQMADQGNGQVSKESVLTALRQIEDPDSIATSLASGSSRRATSTSAGLAWPSESS